jgi:hypothetical protein
LGFRLSAGQFRQVTEEIASASFVITQPASLIAKAPFGRSKKMAGAEG